jgi:LysR family transcriptional regulator, malonate utilization transcriptional regulator
MLNEEITLRKLEILCSFVRTGSLSRTAEELHLSAVSIHKALHSLEVSIACPLFIKEGRQLKPLPAALYLAEASSEWLGDMERILKKTRAKAGVESSQIRLGSMYSLTANIIPRMITGTKIRRPELDIDLYLGSNADLLKKLSEGAVDAIVIAVPSENLPEGVQVVPLFEDQLYLASSKKNKPQEVSVDLSLYRDEQFLTLQDGFATTASFYEAFKLAGFKPSVVMKVGDIFSLMNMVSGDMGRTLLPGRVQALMGDTLDFTPLMPKFQVFQHIGLMYLQANETNANILALAAETRMLQRNKP